MRHRTFQDGVLKVVVDIEFVLDVLADIGYSTPHCKDERLYFLVKTNGKKWASGVDTSDLIS